jgi:hypothetical protein
MKRTFWLYLFMVAFGIAAVAWPEADHLMYIQFSETHGPSKLDLAGLLVIMMGFLPMVKEVWKRRIYIRGKLGDSLWWVTVVFSILPLGFIALGLYIGSDFLLWTSVGVCVIAQGVLIGIAFRQSSPASV